jgi:hypothetical protein
VAEIAGALVLLSGGATAAAAIAPSVATSATIHGCANDKTGALTVLLKSGAKCPKGTTTLSWNKTGPQGPAGTTGVFGSATNAASEGTGGATCTVGGIILTAGSIDPAGSLLANGQILSIDQYTALFALLGTKYGGNGTTTFALPNLQKAAPDGLSYSICVVGDYP